MNDNTLAILLSLLRDGTTAARPAADPGRYFAIEVVDEQTGRGVPMVELQTTSGVRYYTDSAGLVAFDEPGLMGRKVFFGVSAHGYEFATDGFGIRGVVLEPKPGGVARAQDQAAQHRRAALPDHRPGDLPRHASCSAASRRSPSRCSTPR